MYKKIKIASLLITFLAVKEIAIAQTDTLRVLCYNILYIGDTPPCQGPHNIYEGYLEQIVSYVNADIVGLVKREAEDSHGSAPVGFADSLLQSTFNAAFPGRFAYCPYTNLANASNITTLFYNQQKLGSLGILCTYSNITDFDTYKLYYKTTDLATTHDTIFLYVTLNHDNSGNDGSDASIRAGQIAGEMAQIETHFSSLPNMINMGDFNTDNSSEACYQTLVAPTNPAYRYYDPPFYPDATFSYPADWTNHPNSFASCLTTSTRISSSLPNSCSGSSGGGKSWYDHIFLSASIINNSDYISYLPHSFKVLGNDGNRVGNAVNGSPTNTSAPSSIINDIFQLSEHYPISLDLLVNTSDNAVTNVLPGEEIVTVVNPVSDQLKLRLSKNLSGKSINMVCVDVLGRVQIKTDFEATDETYQMPCSLVPGIYYIRFTKEGKLISQYAIMKN